MFSLQHLWTRTSVFTLLLLPLSWLFTGVSALRRLAYTQGWRQAVTVGVPVVVVGNITAGGSGKTPLVIWLVDWLQARGLRPGVVSRGYGGTVDGCTEVNAESDAAVVGDEPLLIHLKTAAPVVVGRDRVAAARMLMARHAVDLIVSDDGLQHYRLHRDLEIVVVDAATGLGNRQRLPAGPLREGTGRLRTVDAVVQAVREPATARTDLPVDAWVARYSAGAAYRLRAPDERHPLAAMPHKDWVAATGIGRPAGFFDMLQAHGVAFTARPFADHHRFEASDLPATDAVLMTEKDGVKCRPFAGSDWWAVELNVQPDPGFVDWLDTRIQHEEPRRTHGGSD